MSVYTYLLLLLALGFTSTQALAVGYTVQKLTGAGIVQIDIQEPNSKIPMTDEEMLMHLQVSRKMRSLKTSKWKNIATKKNLRIAIIGDTGCRIKEGKNRSDYQDCNDKKAWPFPVIMKSLQKEKPDFVIHLGDYHYRESCNKGAACEKMSKSIGYGWSPWRDDFFVPAKTMLASTPWIFVRGNHEDCKRAHVGYNRLLTNADSFDLCSDFEKTDSILIQDLLIVNVDTSAVSENLDPDKKNEQLWMNRFKEIENKIDQLKPKQVWLITHKPFAGLAGFGKNLVPTNPNLKVYLAKSPLAKKIDLIFSGHIHVSQIINPTEGPMQFVLGNSGSALYDLSEGLKVVNLKSMGLESVQIGSAKFGYAILEKKPTGLKISFKDENGKLDKSCKIKIDKKICE